MKRWLIGGLTAAILFIAAISIGFDLFLVKKINPVTPKLDNIPVIVAANPTLNREEVQAFLDEVCEWMRKEEATKAVNRFDLPGLYNIAKQIDLSPDPSLPNLIGANQDRIYPVLQDIFAKNGFGLPWDRIEFDQFLETKYGDPVIAVRQISGDHVVPVWWWIKPTKQGFVILDMEDRLLGLRVSQQYAIALGKGETELRAKQLSEAAGAIRDAMYSIRHDRPQQADLLLEVNKSIPLPAAQQKVVKRLEGLSAAEKGDAARVEAIAAELGDIPVAQLMLAMAAGGEGWQEKRLNAAGKFELEYGPTPLTISVKIQSLVSRDKTDEAVKLLEEGLIRFPDSPSLLAWFAALE